MMKPCDACPWTERDTPSITPEIAAAAQRGDWFCCHVNLGPCAGAKNYAARGKPTMHRLFVYGTLKRGGYWHEKLMTGTNFNAREDEPATFAPARFEGEYTVAGYALMPFTRQVP